MARQLRPGQLRTGSYYDITASLALTGSSTSASIQSFIAFGTITASVAPVTFPAGTLLGTSSFLLTSASLRLLQVTDTGVLILATQSAELPSGSAPPGGIYFTSSSVFVGLE
jgi:hypothetical protein